MVRKIMFSMVFFVSSLVNADVFKLEQTEIKKAIPIIYEEVLKKPYMVDPIILEMNEKISFFINDDVNKSEFFNRYDDVYNAIDLDNG